MSEHVRSRGRRAPLLLALVVVMIALTGAVRLPAARATEPGGGSLAGAIVDEAKAQLNDANRNQENPLGSNCNYYSGALGVGPLASCPGSWRSEEWCADFAKWVYKTAGAMTEGLTPAADSGLKYDHGYSQHGWADRQEGDLAIWNDQDPEGDQHIGIVVDVASNEVTTIAGNTTPTSGSGGTYYIGRHTYTRYLPDGAARFAGFATPET